MKETLCTHITSHHITCVVPFLVIAIIILIVVIVLAALLRAEFLFHFFIFCLCYSYNNDRLVEAPGVEADEVIGSINDSLISDSVADE